MNYTAVGGDVFAEDISLGTITTGSLDIPTGGASNIANYSVTDSIASLNRYLGDITNITGSPTGFLNAPRIYGTLYGNIQPYINTLSNVYVDKVYTANLFAPNGASLIATTIASDATIVAIKANITSSNAAVVSYVNALNTAMIANVSAANASVISNVAVLNANIAGANTAIVTANAYARGYADQLNLAMVANITAANIAIILAQNGANAAVTYASDLNTAMIANVTAANAAIVAANTYNRTYSLTLNSAMIANVNAANAAIVTANAYAKSYADQLNAVMIANIQAVDSAYNTLHANVGAFETYANTTFITGTVGSVIAGIANVSVAVDTFNSRAFSTMKYLLQATHSGEVHSVDLLIVTNGTTVVGTQYSALITSNVLMTLAASISSGNVTVSVTPTYANTSIDFTRIQSVSRL